MRLEWWLGVRWRQSKIPHVGVYTLFCRCPEAIQGLWITRWNFGFRAITLAVRSIVGGDSREESIPLPTFGKVSLWACQLLTFQTDGFSPELPRMSWTSWNWMTFTAANMNHSAYLHGAWGTWREQSIPRHAWGTMRPQCICHSPWIEMWPWAASSLKIL